MNIETKTIAYLRASTNKQNLDSQKLEILDYARKHDIKINDFIEIEISSRRSQKERKINLLLDILNEDDLLIISEISRLGRSVGQIVQTIDKLIKNKVKFIAIKESIHINGKLNIQTKTMVTMFSLFAEIERDLISERTKQGLIAAREKGKLLGRPKGKGKSKLDRHKEEIVALLKNGSTKTFIAKRYSSSLPNLYHWLKMSGISD